MKAQAIEELKHYLAFEKCWDGYDAKQFRQITIDNAIAHVWQVNTEGLIELSPGPCPDGSVDLELRYTDGRVEFVCINEFGIVTREEVKSAIIDPYTQTR